MLNGVGIRGHGADDMGIALKTDLRSVRCNIEFIVFIIICQLAAVASKSTVHVTFIICDESDDV